MGNEQPKLQAKLVEVRPSVEAAQERIVCFKYEIERANVTEDDKTESSNILTEAGAKLAELLDSTEFTMLSFERETVREMKEELAILRGAIEDYTPPDASTESERILMSRVTATLDNTREFIKWIDRKTENTWWLQDLIKMVRTFLTLAVFVSAGLAVHYPDVCAPITLALSICQGVLEALEKVFVRGQDPSQIQLQPAKVKARNPA